MRGIEAAFSATIGQDIELKTSKAGKPFCSFGAVVPMGQDEDGKDMSQWLRVACFGDAAKAIASRAKKGDRVYVEGALTLNTWQGNDGETKTGINIAAWKCERLSNIGRSRLANANSANFAKVGAGEPDEDEAPAKKRTEEPAKGEKTRREYEFNDPLSF